MADKLFWVDANDTELALDQFSFKVLEGMNGRFMPPVSFVEEDIPFQAGSRIRYIKVNARDIDVPLLIKAESEIELRNKVRSILRAFNPLKGDGRLIASAPDGSRRELFCRYSEGLEGNEGKDSKGLSWMKFVLVFRASDPFWYDTMTKVQTFKINDATGLFFPVFPVRLVSSTVFADVTVNNTGDVETWPEWIINGPGENIVLRNMTTGEWMNLVVTLDVGETLTINTQQFKKTVTKNDGTNLFYTLSDDSSLWSLQEGENSIQIEMANASTESSIQLSYRNRYWGP